MDHVGTCKRRFIVVLEGIRLVSLIQCGDVRSSAERQAAIGRIGAADPKAESGYSLARPTRVLHLISHPIQYFAPLYRRLASVKNLDLTVTFYSDAGTRATLDP